MNPLYLLVKLASNVSLPLMADMNLMKDANLTRRWAESDINDTADTLGIRQRLLRMNLHKGCPDQPEARNLARTLKTQLWSQENRSRVLLREVVVPVLEAELLKELAMIRVESRRKGKGPEEVPTVNLGNGVIKSEPKIKAWEITPPTGHTLTSKEYSEYCD